MLSPASLRAMNLLWQLGTQAVFESLLNAANAEGALLNHVHTLDAVGFVGCLIGGVEIIAFDAVKYARVVNIDQGQIWSIQPSRNR